MRILLLNDSQMPADFSMPKISVGHVTAYDPANPDYWRRVLDRLTDGRSDADKLRQVIEMFVPCVQGKAVLQDQRGQPHVVGRNGRALFA